MDDMGGMLVKEQSFLESTIERMISTNNSINSANTVLRDILTKLRGNVPSNLNQTEKNVKQEETICSKIDVLLKNNVEPLNELHNQINELQKYI